MQTVSYKKNLFTIFLLSFCGSIIYGLPYFRKYYYDAYVSTYELTNLEMGLLSTAYGVLGLFSYILGGFLADKFPAKNLLIGSLIATGLGGFLHLYFTSLNALLAIYGLWGITSLLTFWPSLMKVIRTLAHQSEQARAYGIFEGGRGIVGAAHAGIAVSIFAFYESQNLASKGIENIIIFYSSAPIVCGLALCFLLKNTGQSEESEKINFKDFLNLLKMPAIWLVSIITFCTYTYHMSFYYFTPYATNVIGLGAVFAALLTILAQYLRPISATGGGFLADKFGKGQLMLLGFLLMAFGTVLMMLSASFGGFIQMAALCTACAFIYIAMYSNYGIYYSMLSEGKVPLQYAGLAIGIVSTLGYLPEVFAPALAGHLLDTYQGFEGYSYFFAFLIASALVGALFSVVWIKKYGKKESA